MGNKQNTCGNNYGTLIQPRVIVNILTITRAEILHYSDSCIKMANKTL